MTLPCLTLSIHLVLAVYGLHVAYFTRSDNDAFKLTSWYSLYNMLGVGMGAMGLIGAIKVSLRKGS